MSNSSYYRSGDCGSGYEENSFYQSSYSRSLEYNFIYKCDPNALKAFKDEGVSWVQTPYGIKKDEPAPVAKKILSDAEVAKKRAKKRLNILNKFSARIRYFKVPNRSFSTRTQPGDRARLVYYPLSKPKKVYKEGMTTLGGYKFTPRLRERKKQLADSRSAKFSMAIDAGWNINKPRQLSFSIDSLSYGTLFGLTYLERQKRNNELGTKKGRRRPELYQPVTEPFYYNFELDSYAFFRSWDYATNAALAVKKNKHWDIGPSHTNTGEPKWKIGDCIELCRTPLYGVKVHYENGKVAVQSDPDNPSGSSPVAYEIVSLKCVRKIPKEWIVYNAKKDKDVVVESSSGYSDTRTFEIQIRRVGFDPSGIELPVSFLGCSTDFRASTETIVNLAQRLPTFIDDVEYALIGNPRLDRQGKGGFVVSHGFWNKAAEFYETFHTEYEAALLKEPWLYEGDCYTRLQHPEKPAFLLNLDPKYFDRLCSLAAGELFWRDYWEISEWQAREDIRRVECFLYLTYLAAISVYIFYKVFITAFLDRVQAETVAKIIAFGTSKRRSLSDRHLKGQSFCRGPPPLPSF